MFSVNAHNAITSSNTIFLEELIHVASKYFFTSDWHSTNIRLILFANENFCYENETKIYWYDTISAIDTFFVVAIHVGIFPQQLGMSRYPLRLHNESTI